MTLKLPNPRPLLRVMIPSFRFLVHPPISFVWWLVTLTRFPGLSHSPRSYILPSTRISHHLWPLFGIHRLYTRRLTPHYRLGSRCLLALHSHSSHFHTRGLTFRPFPSSDSFVLSPSCHPCPQLVNHPSFGGLATVQNHVGYNNDVFAFGVIRISGSRRAKCVKSSVSIVGWQFAGSHSPSSSGEIAYSLMRISIALDVGRLTGKVVVFECAPMKVL